MTESQMTLARLVATGPLKDGDCQSTVTHILSTAAMAGLKFLVVNYATKACAPAQCTTLRVVGSLPVVDPRSRSVLNK